MLQTFSLFFVVSLHKICDSSECVGSVKFEWEKSWNFQLQSTAQKKHDDPLFCILMGNELVSISTPSLLCEMNECEFERFAFSLHIHTYYMTTRVHWKWLAKQLTIIKYTFRRYFCLVCLFFTHIHRSSSSLPKWLNVFYRQNHHYQ